MKILKILKESELFELDLFKEPVDSVHETGLNDSFCSY